MGKPYSLDLRERIVRYVRQGHSARAAATVFGVAPSTAVRLAAADRDNAQIAPKRQGRGWIQNSSATPWSLAKASKGVRNPRHFRGVVL